MFRFRRTGRIKAAEVNRWNKLADQQARGELRRAAGASTLKNYDPSSRVAICKNTSGADRQVFEVMAIEGLLWALESDGTADVVFELKAADAAKAPAVLIEPIADGECGRAVLDGLAIAKVGGGTGLVGSVDAANHRFKPEGGGPIRLLAAPHATDEKILPVVLGDVGNCVLIKTPAGGIPAATGSGPYTFGSAACTVVDDAGTVTTQTVTVKNIVNQAIAANVIGKAERYGTILVIDVASCGA